MISKNNIRSLVSKMTDDIQSNIKKIKREFGRLDYTDEDNQSILHILVDDKYDETKCFLAIKSLLEIGLSPNLEADYNYNFIQTALYAGYSEKFILNIITESLKHNLNVNHVDGDKDTIMHTAIYSDDYLGEVERIYELLCANGFDSTLTDGGDNNLFEAMIIQNNVHGTPKYSKQQTESFKQKFEERYLELNKDDKPKEVKKIVSNTRGKQDVSVTNLPTSLSSNDILELEKYGRLLNKKHYITAPTIGRERELKNLMITLAQDKKNPLIVGESGVGKTTIVDELAYRIKTGQAPLFLQGKTILEVNPNEIVANCQYVGMFEDKMTKLMKLCEKFDVIVFIDEIHTIYGVGSTKDKNSDMSSILKYYIDRANIKVIGTTTEKEYNEYFGEDALKRRFEKITVKEPTEEILSQIINKVIGDYYIKSGITFENENIRNEIVNVILNATKKSHRVYNDIVNNPDLSISIIDKAFAFAKVYDSKIITSEHFIESFECCDRIYDTAKESAITNLKRLDVDTAKTKNKILKIDFNKFKK